MVLKLFNKKAKEEPVVVQPIQEVPAVPVQEVAKESKPKEVYQVVMKLPVQEVRTGKLDDGTIVHFMTVEEALTEVLNAGTE